MKEKEENKNQSGNDDLMDEAMLTYKKRQASKEAMKRILTNILFPDEKDIALLTRHHWAELICHYRYKHFLLHKECPVDDFSPFEIIQVLNIFPDVSPMFDLKKLGLSEWKELIEKHPGFIISFMIMTGFIKIANPDSPSAPPDENEKKN